MLKTKNKPHFITLDPTTVCNLRCAQCHNANGLFPTYFMDTQQVDEVLELSKTQSGLRVSVTGTGDILCHPRWKQIIEQLGQGNEINSEFYTNALLLTEEDIDFCWSIPSLKVIHVSIDAANADTYKNIRGANFKKLTTILKKLCSYPERGVVRISMVLMQENVNQTKEFVDYAAEIGADVVSYQAMFDRSYTPINTKNGFVFDNSQKIPASEIGDLILEAAKYAKTKRIFVDTERMPELYKYRIMVEHRYVMRHWMNQKRQMWGPGTPEAKKEMAEVAKKTACPAPWLELSRTQAGWRVCCMQFPNTSLGGKDATLEEAWNSPEIQRVREQLLNHECPPECDQEHCAIARRLPKASP